MDKVLVITVPLFGRLSSNTTVPELDLYLEKGWRVKQLHVVPNKEGNAMTLTVWVSDPVDSVKEKDA